MSGGMLVMTRTHWAVFCALLLAFYGCDDDNGSDDTDDGPADDGGTGDDDGGPDDDGGGDDPDAELIPDCERDDECAADRYCHFEPDQFVGGCVPGCRVDEADRQSTCAERQMCIKIDEGDLRDCVRDPFCEKHADCLPRERCEEELCIPTECLPADEESGQEDTCPSTEGDPPIQQLCNEAFECEPVVVCCTGETCDQRLEAGCNIVLRDRNSCFNPNPCDGRCPNGDNDCDEEEYCNDEALCEPGCRPEERNACPDEVCNPETHQCEPTVCETSEDCEPQQFCALNNPGEGECILGCRLEPVDNCPEGSVCNAARQCAEGCETDEQCSRRHGDGFYCFFGACTPPCAEDSECPEPPETDFVYVCDLEIAQCDIGCRDDGFEEDDEPDEATPLDFGDTPNEFISPPDFAYVCPEDPDFFSFVYPNVGGVVEVTIDFLNVEGDLDLRVYVPGEERPRRSQGAGDREQIRVLDAPRGMYFVEVFGRGVDENDFTLSVRFLDPEGCQPDAADTDDDEAESATRMPLPERQDAQTLEAREHCIGDVDWYVFPMSPGDGLTVTVVELGNEHHGNDLIVGDSLDFQIYGPPGVPGPQAEALFAPNGNGVLPEEEGGHRFISYHAPRLNPQIGQGDYYLRVVGADEEQESAYRLEVEVDRRGNLCLADETEPNDERQDAYDLMQIEDFVTDGVAGGIELRPLEDLDFPTSLCHGDEADWFAIELDRDDALTATILRHDYEPPDAEPANRVVEGDSIIEILDANGALLNRGRNDSWENSARYGGALPGDYWVKVTVPVPETTFNYTLRLFRVPGDGDCPRDRFDQRGNNGLRENATPVSPNEDYEALTLCGVDDDIDWYCFDVDAVSTVTVSIESPEGGNTLALDYFDPDGAHVNENEGQGHRQGDRQEVSYNQQLPGRYCVRVTSVFGNNRYTLRVDVNERVFVCEDDPDEGDEGNDRRGDAVALPDGEFDREAQWLCHRIPAEEDWFVLDVPANQERILVTSFVFGDDGDLFIEAYGDDDMLLASTINVGRNISKQCMVIAPAPGDRLLWFKVAPLNINLILEDDERLDYDLHVRDSQDCEEVGVASGDIVWPVIEEDD